MRLWDQFSFSGTAIKTRKTRAGLTTLGITIGITAIVALLSLGNGFQSVLNSQFENGFATNEITVSQRSSFGVGGSTVTSFNLYANDSDIISSLNANLSAPYINFSVPLLQTQSCNITLNGTNFRVGLPVGVNFTAYTNLYPTTFATTNGSIPTDPNNNSIVIGSRLTEGPLNLTLGQSLNLTWFEYGPGATIIAYHNLSTVVAGVLPSIGGFALGGPSDGGIYMQPGVAENFFNTTKLSAIVVSLTTSDSTIIANVSKTIQNQYDNLVTAVSATAVLGTIQSIFSTVELFIAAIAAISLIVAGIGIMNVQITSVLERTREIGIMKAIGAKDRTILSVFLIETLFIGILGALFGIGLGYGLSFVFGRFIGSIGGGGGGFGGAFGGGSSAATSSGGISITPVLSWDLIGLAVGFGVLIAVIFAFTPRGGRLG